MDACAEIIPHVMVVQYDCSIIIESMVQFELPDSPSTTWQLSNRWIVCKREDDILCPRKWSSRAIRRRAYHPRRARATGVLRY